MSYCPHCGEQVSSEFQFCNHCGEQIPTDETSNSAEESGDTPPESDTLQVKISESFSSSIRTYKIGNFTFLKRTVASLTTLGKLLVLGTIVLAFGAIVWSSNRLDGDDLAAAALGIGMVPVALYFLLLDDDGLQLGTVAGTDELVASDASNTEEKFLDRTANTIAVSGTVGGLWRNLEYRYHFVPKNIVSITRMPSLYSNLMLVSVVAGVAVTVGSFFGPRELLLVAAACFAPASVQLLLRASYIKERGKGNVVIPIVILPGLPAFAYAMGSGDIGGYFYMGAAVLLGIIAIPLLLALPGPGVLVRTSGEEKLGFRMSESDADQLTIEFRE